MMVSGEEPKKSTEAERGEVKKVAQWRDAD
jgi:hypothetical protein